VHLFSLVSGISLPCDFFAIDWLADWRVDDAAGVARVDRLTRKLTSSTWTFPTVHARFMCASGVIQTPTHWRPRPMEKRVQTAAGMSERSWFHSSFRTLTDQITYLTVNRLARVEIRQSVPKTAWETCRSLGRSLNCPDIVGERGWSLHCPYAVKKRLEDVSSQDIRVMAGWRVETSAPSDRWLKIFGCEGDGVKEDSYQRPLRNIAAILRRTRAVPGVQTALEQDWASLQRTVWVFRSCFVALNWLSVPLVLGFGRYSCELGPCTILW